MKILPATRFGFVLPRPAFFLLAGIMMAAGALTAQTNAPAKDQAISKSVFDDRLKTGRDPFFPNSTRLANKAPVAPVVPDAGTTPTPPPPAQLILKGIANQFALINNQTFAVGETHIVKYPGGQVKIKCVEIGAGSATIVIDGETEKKVLRLKD